MLICALDLAASLGRISAEIEARRIEGAHRSSLRAHERRVVDLACNHVTVSFAGEKHVESRAVLEKNYEKVFASLKARG